MRGLRFHSSNFSRFASLSVVVGCVLCQSGCVSRRLIVHSEPAGALVLLEGREIGYTPTAVDFNYYATRELTLIKDGYETTTVLQKTPRPWYQWPGVNFVADNFWPHRATDRHVLNYKLRPKMVPPEGDLLNRAEQLRTDAQLGR